MKFEFEASNDEVVIPVLLIGIVAIVLTIVIYVYKYNSEIAALPPIAVHAEAPK